jgi:hypothetical protein
MKLSGAIALALIAIPAVAVTPAHAASTRGAGQESEAAAS